MAQVNNVLQVVGEMNRGGAEVMLMDIYRNISPMTKFSFLVNHKINNRITEGDFDQEIINNGSVIKHIGTQWDLGPISFIKEFKRVYKELGSPEVVHIHLNSKCGIIAMAAKLAGAKKIIAHSHADLKFRGSFLRNSLNKVELFFQKFLIAQYATDFWGASSEANESLYFKNFNLKKSVIINNAVDTDKFQNISQKEVLEFKQSLDISEETIVLGSVGRVVRHKKVDYIIDVLNEFKKVNPNFIFLFAGRVDDEIYFKEIEAKTKKYSLNNNIIHLGNRGDVPLIMNSLDVFISPALKEGFGLVAAESQAAGVPCVLYKGFPNSVNMDLGLVDFMDDFDVKKWSNAILKSLKTKPIEKEMIKERIENNGFDIKKNTKKIEQFYRI